MSWFHINLWGSVSVKFWSKGQTKLYVCAVLALPNHVSIFRVLLHLLLGTSLDFSLRFSFHVFLVLSTYMVFLEAIVIISKEGCISGPDLLPLYLTHSPVVSFTKYPAACQWYVFFLFIEKCCCFIGHPHSLASDIHYIIWVFLHLLNPINCDKTQTK